uniref:Uncharacterized protein n=1 Tax=Cucumis melo TaxID=3656 RepID=A0A9I9CVI8_CUCME
MGCTIVGGRSIRSQGARQEQISNVNRFYGLKVGGNTTNAYLSCMEFAPSPFKLSYSETRVETREAMSRGQGVRHAECKPNNGARHLKGLCTRTCYLPPIPRVSHPTPSTTLLSLGCDVKSTDIILLLNNTS